MSKVYVNQDMDGKTIIVGQADSKAIARIYISGERQIMPNEYNYTLNRLGNVNKIKNSDYQKGFRNLCPVSDWWIIPNSTLQF